MRSSNKKKCKWPFLSSLVLSSKPTRIWLLGWPTSLSTTSSPRSSWKTKRRICSSSVSSLSTISLSSSGMNCFPLNGPTLLVSSSSMHRKIAVWLDKLPAMDWASSLRRLQLPSLIMTLLNCGSTLYLKQWRYRREPKSRRPMETAEIMGLLRLERSLKLTSHCWLGTKLRSIWQFGLGSFLSSTTRGKV